MSKNNLPSIFIDADAPANDATEAPTFITRVTAHVLGALIAENLLAYDGDAWATLQMAEKTIAAALDRAVDSIDTIELDAAQDAREKARHIAAPSDTSATE